MAIHPQLFARRLDTSQATMPCVRSSRLLLPDCRGSSGRLLDARSQREEPSRPPGSSADSPTLFAVGRPLWRPLVVSPLTGNVERARTGGRPGRQHHRTIVLALCEADQRHPVQTEPPPQDRVTRRRLSTNRGVAPAHIRWPSSGIRCGPGSNRTGRARRLLPGLFRR
jgi:hypothetical protein